MEWIQPKTNWVSTDKFNIEDFNRIRNNILYIHQYTNEMSKEFNIDSMGDEITSFESFWNVDFFNAFENNIDLLNSHLLSEQYGLKMTFRENAPFIKSDELNRLEKAIERMGKIVQGYIKAKYRYPLRLGGLKGINV
ncbi:MAG: hypothetical protein MJ236_00815 [Clostridia bacterium]|nr:hypothetical protein [Clostridia bacterium]